ncbi:hypothetical protein H8356DRAFT_1355331 [Neocallimastix lanati (nom. inval.)]|nr:hypothetical protein H8356DRAFT_1355331 [Neocallimastix sp. JGI-2020a]
METYKITFCDEFEASISITKHKIGNKKRKKIGFISPEYNEIKSQITRNINKQQPPDVTKFDEIHNESKYYKMVRNENFMIFENPNLIIFQSPFNYKMFITRIYIKDSNTFYTTSFNNTIITPKCNFAKLLK